ncbi:MAG: chemotaxis protein CheX [bacterium]
MKVEHINPFIESVYDLFSTMIQCEVKKGDIGVIKSFPQSLDIIGLIGLSGETRGNVAMSFPISTALALVSRLLGTEIRVVDATVSDGIAEIVNIVAGGAKKRLSLGTPSNLSLPTIVRGNSFSIDYPSETVWLEVPFTSELGPFTLRVTFEVIKEK